MRPSAKSRNSSRGSRLPERELTSIFFNGLLSAAWANFRGTDWKIRCFLPKMPNSSKTCGPRGRPGGSLSARNSTGLCENNERRSIAALVNLTDADVARPEFVLCPTRVRPLSADRAVIRAQRRRTIERGVLPAGSCEFIQAGKATCASGRIREMAGLLLGSWRERRRDRKRNNVDGAQSDGGGGVTRPLLQGLLGWLAKPLAE